MNALGMRASGSHSIVYQNCIVADAFVTPLAPYGGWHEPFIGLFMPGNFGFVAVFLGIAETAHTHVMDDVTTRTKAPSNRTLSKRLAIQQTIAENEIDLAACCAMIERTGRMMDELFDTYLFMTTPHDELHAMFKDFQCTKCSPFVYFRN
jgi:alkylation response protein AidB-like acyl-CoA dehydrogenase